MPTRTKSVLAECIYEVAVYNEKERHWLKKLYFRTATALRIWNRRKGGPRLGDSCLIESMREGLKLPLAEGFRLQVVRCEDSQYLPNTNYTAKKGLDKRERFDVYDYRKQESLPAANVYDASGKELPSLFRFCPQSGRVVGFVEENENVPIVAEYPAPLRVEWLGKNGKPNSRLNPEPLFTDYGEPRKW